ncbi:MAG: hypothetical protein WKF34_07775 [Pyrinomonadaceae bacterium]
MRFLLIAIFLVLSGLAAHAQGEFPIVEEIYLAKDDGDGKAGEQVTEFRTSDVPIYCVVLLDSHVTTIVKMNFVAVSVNGVRPETKVVTASYTTQAGQNRVNFTGRPEGKWTAGRYRVDLFVNGKIAKNMEFEIKGPAGGASVTSAKLVESPPVRPARRLRKP